MQIGLIGAGNMARALAKEGKGEAKEKPRSFTDKIAELLDDGGGKRRR